MTHIPVLLNEVLEHLSTKDGETYFDGTFGGGGYTSAILNSAKCNVVACDRDPFVQKIANKIKEKYKERFKFYHSKFSDIQEISNSSKKSKFDAIILDLGVSNFQLANSDRGFSFQNSGPLDMSMGLTDETALDIIQKYSETDLANIIYEYGEEHFSRRIAKSIKNHLKNISTTEDLAEIINKCVPRRGKINPATKTFQALRIFTNKELEELENILEKSINFLNKNGKIIVVSFHSMEDRIVKRFFKSKYDENKLKYKIITKKPIIPSRDEIISNPKSRSAKLRVFSMIE